MLVLGWDYFFCLSCGLFCTLVLYREHLITLNTKPQQLYRNINRKLLQILIPLHKTLITIPQTIPYHPQTRPLIPHPPTPPSPSPNPILPLKRKNIRNKINNNLNLRLLTLYYFYFILFEMLFVFLLEELVIVMEEPIELLEIVLGLLGGWVWGVVC